MCVCVCVYAYVHACVFVQAQVYACYMHRVYVGTEFSPVQCYALSQVKAATGEEVSAEDLGGADLHCGYCSLIPKFVRIYTLITGMFHDL